MNVPYTPPSRRYFPIEDVAKFAPNLGYQADFAEQTSTSKVENQVSKPNKMIMYRFSCHRKLPGFLSSLYAAPEFPLRFSGQGALQRMLTKDYKASKIVLTEKVP